MNTSAAHLDCISVTSTQWFRGIGFGNEIEEVVPRKHETLDKVQVLNKWHRGIGGGIASVRPRKAELLSSSARENC
eukprot:4855050-Pleurochrysis_carterae.AAC.2